ncbi:hypothetical protein L3556_02705 [Candidatus Synechococcus calcipolaris G9]|uniref:Uncharacterized protein n=1 Tax=Candidatus Synechococcus calcipolaris G9 TaxID=1497997 RepID=A0ABT6EVL7_9SYNE|nr:hypothetical protein [Candidatus Synechococcus calcipolaris]MDG2989849.1 hypothetical protein [Candidatus Synechococcus calcipolaris G9]
MGRGFGNGDGGSGGRQWGKPEAGGGAVAVAMELRGIFPMDGPGGMDMGQPWAERSLF